MITNTPTSSGRCWFSVLPVVGLDVTTAVGCESDQRRPSASCCKRVPLTSGLGRNLTQKKKKNSTTRSTTCRSRRLSEESSRIFTGKHTFFTSWSEVSQCLFTPRSCDPDGGPVPVETTADSAGAEKKERHFSDGWFVCRRSDGVSAGEPASGHRGALLWSVA